MILLNVVPALIYLSKCFASFSISEDGISITYEVSKLSTCRIDKTLARRTLGDGLSDCVIECGLQHGCKALSYNRHVLMCELYTSITTESFIKGSCIYISSTDIYVEKSPCEPCDNGKACDRQTKTCIYKECLDTSLGSDNFSGNINSIGSKISHQCTGNDWSENKGKHLVCQDNGLWSSTDVCTRTGGCGQTPTISNGNITAHNGTLFGAMAIVSCDMGYVASANTSTCNNSGYWSTAQCDIINCGQTPIIPNGNITVQNGTLFGAMAVVSCDIGYVASANTSTCNTSGYWSTIQCDIINCGQTPVISKGQITAHNGTIFGAMAIVSCDIGYLASVDISICNASGFWSLAQCDFIRTDCYDVITDDEQATSGLYNITMWMSNEIVQVYCDMDTTGGGWTVFQYRYDGSVEFYRNFSDYENGFGDLTSEFWLGLGVIQELASQGQTELRLDLMAANGTTAYEIFTNFHLDKGPQYTLHIDPGYGTAGDVKGLSYNNGYSFSTFDAGDNQNCAVERKGGWWYYQCSWANLNGEYVTPGDDIGYPGMIYYSFQESKSLKISKMMLRRYLGALP